MADFIVIFILLLCAALALRSCLKKKPGKNGCGNCSGTCNSCHHSHTPKNEN